jgi:Fur family iron response transcriptional regulator
MEAQKYISDQDISARLMQANISTTRQRMAIAGVLFRHGRHVSAEEVYVLVNHDLPAGQHQVSKATVYNTLGLFARAGLVREVIADPTRVFYDPNTEPHHHFYDIDTGELTDIDVNDIRLQQLPEMPDDTQLHGVDVIIRVSRRAAP